MASNFPGQQSRHQVGDRIASQLGGVQYEDDQPGKSLTGGAVPTTGQSIHQPINGSGGVSGTQQFQGTQQSHPASSLGASSPNVTDVGLNTGGQNTAEQVKQANHPQQASASSGPASTSGQPSQVENSSTLYDSATRGAYVAANKAQELAEPLQPYIQKVQESVGPYVQTAVDNTAPYVQQAREAASPYVEKASALANQGIQATATELDKRGVNMDALQQKTADVTRSLKDYGAVGQARAGEYLQQAVDQANTLRTDGENRNIFATVFGTIALIWLAFGFSLTALLALGIAGGLAAILSRYSRAAVGSRGQPTTSGAPAGNVSGGARTGNAPGVETHYPNPSHPDNSLNN